MFVAPAGRPVPFPPVLFSPCRLCFFGPSFDFLDFISLCVERDSFYISPWLFQFQTPSTLLYLPCCRSPLAAQLFAFFFKFFFPFPIPISSKNLRGFAPVSLSLIHLRKMSFTLQNPFRFPSFLGVTLPSSEFFFPCVTAFFGVHLLWRPVPFPLASHPFLFFLSTIPCRHKKFPFNQYNPPFIFAFPFSPSFYCGFISFFYTAKLPPIFPRISFFPPSFPIFFRRDCNPAPVS